jgi:DNA-binding NarL/FixJ family response regulator
MNTKMTIETISLLQQNLEGTAPSQLLTQLQEREIVLLCHLITNPTNKEISDKMCISNKSVETYKTRIGSKLGLTGPHALCRFVLKNHEFFEKLAPIFIPPKDDTNKDDTKM